MGINGAHKNASQISAVRELTRIALLVAMLSVSSYIVIPVPFSPTAISAQTMVVNIVALVLPPRQTLKAMLIYIAVGVAGLPVFLGGGSGIGILVSPAGGYLFGFVAAAYMISSLKGTERSFRRYFLVTLLGIPVIYLPGILQMSAVTGMGLRAALMVGALPFIPGDIFKCAMASFAALSLGKAVKL